MTDFSESSEVCCEYCGYVLHGLEASSAQPGPADGVQCPECGRTTPANARWVPEIRSSLANLGALCLPCGVVTLAFIALAMFEGVRRLAIDPWLLAWTALWLIFGVAWPLQEIRKRAARQSPRIHRSVFAWRLRAQVLVLNSTMVVAGFTIWILRP